MAIIAITTNSSIKVKAGPERELDLRRLDPHPFRMPRPWFGQQTAMPAHPDLLQFLLDFCSPIRFNRL
jgi:hypothetical protein